MAEAAMAKAKAKAKGKGPGKGAAGPGIRTLGVRSSPEWADWLERLARRHRTTVAGLLDRAVSEWAAGQGHDEPPPERLP